MIPGLGDDAGRLEQHSGSAERRIDFDEKFRLDAEIVRAKTVPLLDAAFGVAAVAAHVPFPDSTSRTWDRIGAAHNADDGIASLEAGAGRRLFDLSEGLVADHKALRALRRPAVMAGYDFAIRSADPQRQRFHQNRTVR